MGVVAVPDPPVTEQRSSCLPWVLLALLVLLLLGLLLFFLLGGGDAPAPVVIPTTSEATEATTLPTVEATTLPTTTEATVIPTTEPDRENRPWYYTGGCTRLSGKVAVVVLFVDDDTSSWTADEVAAYRENTLDPGMDYLQQQAASYGVPLELTVYPYMTDTDRVIRADGLVNDGYDNSTGTILQDPAGWDANRNVLEGIAINWGFRDADAMHGALLEQTGSDQVAYVIACDKDGWAHAWWGLDQEFCVIFSGNAYGSTELPSTAAHELMHLFGAEDLYKSMDNTGTEKRVQREQLAKQLCPTDLMLTSYYDISENTIGGFTAYCVGWLDQLPQEYNVPEWFEE